MKAENVKPLNEKVLIKVMKDEEVTRSGIIIPKTSEVQRASKTGMVLNHGSSALVQDGDTVIFDAYRPIKIELHEYEDNDVILIDDKYILAIIC